MKNKTLAVLCLTAAMAVSACQPEPPYKLHVLEKHFAPESYQNSEHHILVGFDDAGKAVECYVSLDVYVRAQPGDTILVTP